MEHIKNEETLMQMTEDTLKLHVKVGRLDIDRKTKEDLYRLLGDFSGKLAEVVEND